MLPKKSSIFTGFGNNFHLKRVWNTTHHNLKLLYLIGSINEMEIRAIHPVLHSMIYEILMLAPQAVPIRM